MRASNFDVDIIISSLNGSCTTLEECIVSHYEGMTLDDLIDEDHAKIDSEIFCCGSCGWWNEVSDEASEEAKEAQGESVDDQICKDCCPESE